MRFVSVAFLLLVVLVTVASAQTTAPLGPGSGGGPGGGGGGGASPAGATGTVQYNAGSGLFGGITNWKTSGTNDLTGSSGSTLAVNGCTIGSYAMCTGGTSNLIGAVTLGTQQTAQGSLVLANTAAGSFSTTIQSSNSATAAYTITLPVAAPVGNGYALTATTGGVASWSNIGTGPFLPLAGGTMSGALTNTATAPQIILGVNTSVGGGIQMYGSSSGNLTLQPAAAAGSSVTVTIPGATDTLANLASSQTLSNKTIAFASNTMTGVAPLASPTFTGTVTMPDASTFGTTFQVGGNAILTGPAGASLQLGAANVNGSPVAQTLRVQSPLAGSASNTAGANWTLIGGLGTGTGTGGDIIFQTNVKTTTGSVQGTATTALTIKGETQNVIINSGTDATSTSTGSLQVTGGAVVSKRFWIPAISASAGLQTAVLCQSSGGEMIADSVACLASSASFKTIIGDMPNGALSKLAQLPIERWAYKPEGIFNDHQWTRERIGPIAEDVAKMDARLVGYDAEGKVRTYSTEQLLAFTIKALQELKADNDNLGAELGNLLKR